MALCSVPLFQVAILGAAELAARCFDLLRALWSYRRRIAFLETALMPIRVDRCCLAAGVQFGDLRRGQMPVYGSQILAKLVRIARTYDNGRYGRSMEQPVNCDLWDGLAGFL